ncbi:MAG: hypothetical protein KDC34_01320 [Saprospiraceae bacterium]|nr:hypothetical protein [Saprospiraceae bacterium]
MRSTILLLCGLFFSVSVLAQAPDLIGYWQNWNSVNAPYIPLSDIDSRYTIIDVAFALPAAGTTYDMYFTPDATDPGTFMDEVQVLQGDGKKVLISVAGATGQVVLQNLSEKDIFVNSMLDILLTYEFDGMDIDLEGPSVTISGGTIQNPVDQKIILLIQAIQEIMEGYQQMMGKRMLLTFAPETAFVQGGQSAYNGVWGAYLPILDALRDSIEILHVQLYNSGSMYGIDGGIYYQSTADFIVSQTEALLQGFDTDGGFFGPMEPRQIAVGLPACQNAAGGGYTDPDIVESAIQYLLNGLQQPGTYSSFDSYPQLRGMMTWSINWDALSSCSGSYTYAQNYQDIFGNVVDLATISESTPLFTLFPNPLPQGTLLHFDADSRLSSIRIYDQLGRIRWNYDYEELGDLIREIELPLEKGFFVVVGNSTNGQVFSSKLIVE